MAAGWVGRGCGWRCVCRGVAVGLVAETPRHLARRGGFGVLNRLGVCRCLWPPAVE